MSENRETSRAAAPILASMEHAADLDQDACYRAATARDPRFDGRFFGCVKTTGIYCRTVCPARTPKRENLFFVKTAAAAEERGFRACLRCRPETAPDMGAWRGTSNTVSRALALIEAGALDGDGQTAGVERLADRLGVGERQLRRLFRQHLGAAPVSVAQTRRVLLAKQLIHESDLSMAQVALASGFGSVRRFNETFQALYGRPPSALRRRADTGQEADGVHLRLRYREPYDWTDMLASLAHRGEVVEGRRWRRVLRVDVDGCEGTVTLSPSGAGEVDVTAALSDLSRLPRVLARVRRLFDLSADPVAIGADLSGDPALRPLVEARPGLRLPGDWIETDVAAGPPSDRLEGSAALLARAEAWRPWRAYGALHLERAGVTLDEEDTIDAQAA